MQVEPQVIFQVLPQPLDWVQLRAVRGQEDQLNVVWNRKGLGFVEPPVVQNQDIQALREPARESIKKVLESVAI